MNRTILVGCLVLCLTGCRNTTRSGASPSFDVLLLTSRPPLRYEDGRNPFTGRPGRFPIYQNLTPDQRAAFRAVLYAANAQKLGDGLDQVKCQDGGIVDVQGWRTDAPQAQDALVTVRRLSLGSAALIFDLAHAGDMIILPTGAEELVLAVSEEQRRRVADRWPRAIVVDSAAELEASLRNSYDAAASYADQVVQGRP